MQSGVKNNKRLHNFNRKSFEKHLNSANDFLYQGKMDEAWDSFHDALTINFESNQAKSGMKIAGFWKERQAKKNLIKDFFEQGEFLLREFRQFEKTFVPGHDINFGLKNIEIWIFNTCCSLYKSYGEMTNNQRNHEILLKQGYCLKKLGNYEKSRELLEEAAGICKDNSSILAQLADVYSLINEEVHAKLFFREAFFIAPQEIDIDSLESVLIKQILGELEAKQYSQGELKEWIPVYGTVLGLFNVKKELKPIEVGLLKQSIYSLNNSISGGSEDKGVIIPKLINHNFRLLEHLVSNRAEKESVDEVLLNIKLLDKTIYELYLN